MVERSLVAAGSHLGTWLARNRHQGGAGNGLSGWSQPCAQSSPPGQQGPRPASQPAPSALPLLQQGPFLCLSLSPPSLLKEVVV